MALTLVHMDGFDEYSTAQLGRHWSTNAYAEIGAYGRVAGNALRFNSWDNNTSVQTTLTAAASHCVSIGFKSSFNPTYTPTIVALLDGATVHTELRLKPGGILSVSRNGTELATSETLRPGFALSVDTYYHIAFAVTVADAPDGKYDVWVDGVKTISGTGDTRNAGNASANVVRLGPNINEGNGKYFYYDDVAVFSGATYTDDDFPGDCRVFTDLPNADGNYTAWAASAGTDVSCVDENPSTDDTDYISSATPGTMETFAFPTIAGSGTVRGVMAVITDRMDDAGPRTINGVARLGATDLVGASPMSCSGSYVAHKELFLTKPGGGAWSLSDVNSAEIGVKLVA